MRRFLVLLAAAGGLTLATSGFSLDSPKLFSAPGVWRDENDAAVSLSTWLGKGPVVVSMAYTNCQRTCPMTLHLMRDIEAKLKPRSPAASFIILSLDPKHDTAERIHEFLGDGPTRASWHFLRGDEQSTKTVAAMLGIDPFDLDDHIVHKFKVWVFDAGGTATKVYDWSHRDLSDL